MRLKKAVSAAVPLVTLLAPFRVASLAAVAVSVPFLTFGPFAWAGPVERELNARGGNVGTPKPRPSPGTSQVTPDAVLANPLDPPRRDGPRPNVDVLNEPAGQASTGPDVQTVPKTPRETLKTERQVGALKSTSTVSKSACLQELQQIANAEATTSPTTNDSACTIADPVVLIQTNSIFPIQFTRNLTLDCPFALALAKFSDGTAQALARHHLGSAISTIHSGEGFVCRRRNNAPTGKWSEHAFGNATDWVGFTFADGSKLQIKDTVAMDADEAGFLNNLRLAACGTFTTVLGPGSNAAHASHFHFDLGRSKERKNPYRICE